MAYDIQLPSRLKIAEFNPISLQFGEFKPEIPDASLPQKSALIQEERREKVIQKRNGYDDVVSKLRAAVDPSEWEYIDDLIEGYRKNIDDNIEVGNYQSAGVRTDEAIKDLNRNTDVQRKIRINYQRDQAMQKFAKFDPALQAYARELNPYYDDETGNWTLQQDIVESRSLGDWAAYVTQLTPESSSGYSTSSEKSSTVAKNASGKTTTNPDAYKYTVSTSSGHSSSKNTHKKTPTMLWTNAKTLLKNDNTTYNHLKDQFEQDKYAYLYYKKIVDDPNTTPLQRQRALNKVETFQQNLGIIDENTGECMTFDSWFNSTFKKAIESQAYENTTTSSGNSSGTAYGNFRPTPTTSSDSSSQSSQGQTPGLIGVLGQIWGAVTGNTEYKIESKNSGSNNKIPNGETVSSW